MAGQLRSCNLLCQHLYRCRVFIRWFRFSLYCTMHPLGLRSFGIFIPPARRSRARRLSCLSKPNPCSFEPVPLSALADPENLRYHAVSKRKNDNFHGSKPAPQWLTTWAIKMLERNKEVQRRTNQSYGSTSGSSRLSVAAPSVSNTKTSLLP